MSWQLFDDGKRLAHVSRCECSDCGGQWHAEVYDPGYAGECFAELSDAIRWVGEVRAGMLGIQGAQ